MLKLGGCTGGTTSTLPTGYQREPSLGSQVSMLLLAVPAIVLPTGLTRRSTATSAVSQPNQPLSSAASRPELVRHPTSTLPISLPSFSRVPWHTGTWQCVASRRLVWSPSPFRPALPPCPSLGRGPELAKFREARALLSRQCRRTPHPPPGKVSARASCNFSNESPKSMKSAPPNSTRQVCLPTSFVTSSRRVSVSTPARLAHGGRAGWPSGPENILRRGGCVM